MPLVEPIPDISSIDLFLSTISLGSIQQGARAHNITQPAASIRIRNLENTLGVELLERSSQGVRLTPSGAAVAQWCERVIEAVEDLVLGCNTINATTKPKITIGASMTIAEYYVPSWILHLKALAPQLTISLEVTNSKSVIKALREDEIDVGFIESHATTQGFRSKVFAYDELTLLVPPNHIFAKKKAGVTPSQLAKLPILVREFGSGTRDVLEFALGNVGLEPTISAVMGSNTSILQAAEAGIAACVLSSLAAKDALHNGRLIAVRVNGLDLKRSLRAIWKPSKDNKNLKELLSVI